MMQFEPRTKSLVFKADDPFAIRELIPKSKTLPHPDYNMAVQHSMETTRILRNLGYDAPSPLDTGYSWPGKYTPFAHQRKMTEFLVMHDRCFNLSEMGVGKSASALWAADYLMKTKAVRRVLVLSPLSTLERVWMQDIFDVLMHRRAVVVHGSMEQRRKALALDEDFYILNHDGVALKEVCDLLVKRKDIDLIIVDEGSMFRNGSTTKWKALRDLLKRLDCGLWWLTGTPTPNAPTDAWAQAKLVNPSRVPQFFGSFKRDTMMQVSQYKWAPRPGARDLAFAALQPAIRFMKKDCLDLPPVMTIQQQATLTKEQRDAFEEMKETMVAEIALRGSVEMDISAVNAADKLGKLRQILCLSERTPVLTERGWIEIAHVHREDRIWDGVEWVTHMGVVDNGVRDVITSDGVTLTPEHEVLCVQSTDRLDRAPVRLPHCAAAARYDRGTIEESNMALRVHLRQQGGAREPEPAVCATAERETLWVPARLIVGASRHEQSTTVPDMDAYEAAVSRSIVQRLQELRSEGHHRLRSLGAIVWRVLGGHVSRLRGRSVYRTDRQQRPVHPIELSVGNSERTARKPATARVMDIMNCGPRHRFVVRGSDGELLLVHNCGAIKDPQTDTYFTIPHQPRLDVLMQSIESADAKAIVIVPFKGIIQQLEKEVSKTYSVGVLNGDVSITKRNQIITDFKTTDHPHVLLCHPKVMAHGLNLTEADTLIFYAPIYSNDEYQQVIERFNRAGQTRKMTVVRIGAHPLEWQIYRMLDQRMQTQDDLLSLYRNVAKGTYDE